MTPTPHHRPWAVLAALLGVCPVAWAQTASADPTLPPPAWRAPAAAADGTNPAADAASNGPQVSLILVGPQRRLALVGGDLHRVGSQTADGTVTAINRRGVTLRSAVDTRTLPAQSPAVVKVLRP